MKRNIQVVSEQEFQVWLKEKQAFGAPAPASIETPVPVSDSTSIIVEVKK